MIKQFFLLINIISIFFYQLFFSSDVSVKQTLPSTIAPNGEVTVTFTITKGDVAGFAMLKQTIPLGFVVEPIENKGATFSFKDQIVKYIWMSLPQDNEFTISYKLKNVSQDAGNYSLDGKFSYLADNEKSNIDIPSANFSVSSGEELPQIVNETETKTEEPTSTSKTEIAELSIDRTIDKISENKFKVSITISKQNVDGFAKLIETIPNEFSASQDKSQGGIFSFENGEVKLLWLAIPTQENFTASYFIETTSASGSKSISGVFSYLEGEETKKHSINSSSFNVDFNNEIVENTTAKEKQETSLQEKVTNENSKNIDNTSKKKEEDKKPITTTPAPETGITYKVQVGAFRENIVVDKFKKKFNLKENINLENHEGWTKLTTGSFNEYKSARDKRNMVRNNVKTAFVTAYNKGNRITVQVALMVSNQKWLK
ncbi:MAG: SPOR domain-containing protein [Flavobacteriales bacterium]|nr:SPOR domain-containing protein [Flavobacteriales bacterium]